MNLAFDSYISNITLIHNVHRVAIHPKLVLGSNDSVDKDNIEALKANIFISLIIWPNDTSEVPDFFPNTLRLF